jgi:hypothetical protein
LWHRPERRCRPENARICGRFFMGQSNHFLLRNISKATPKAMIMQSEN